MYLRSALSFGVPGSMPKKNCICRPPDPYDDDASRTSSSHDPMREGPFRIATGLTGSSGWCTRTVPWTGRLVWKQSPARHRTRARTPPTSAAENSRFSFTFSVAPKPNTTSRVCLRTKEHVGSAPRARSVAAASKLLQLKTPVRPALSVCSSNSMLILPPEFENCADIARGGRASATFMHDVHASV
eukprot:1902235-Rhodomonas_salina.1